jgi:hypothetical protein
LIGDRPAQPDVPDLTWQSAQSSENSFSIASTCGFPMPATSEDQMMTALALPSESAMVKSAIARPAQAWH